MSDEERASVLKMVEDGKITPEEALILIQALEEETLEDSPGYENQYQAEPEVKPAPTPDPEFEKKLKRYKNLWIIPLSAGVVLTVLGAYWVFWSMSSSGFGFWFACAWLPFILGTTVVALSAVSKYSRWIYVNVEQKKDDWPKRIIIAFPIPSGILRWGVKNFGHNIPPEHRDQVDFALKSILEGDGLSEPLFVDVDDEDANVQVYIG
jgi:hypothetical protein